MQTAQKITFLSALAFIVVFANTNAAHAASATNGATLFQVAEVSAPVKIAAGEDANTDEKTGDHKCSASKTGEHKCSAKAGEHKNWFQSHCAGRLFHHKKHSDATTTEEKEDK